MPPTSATTLDRAQARTPRRPVPVPAPARRPGGRWREATWLLLYAAVTCAAAVTVIGPDALAWREGFIAWSNPVPGETLAPGDHLQLSYYLWLWEHALTTFSHLPWLDPFQLAAGGDAATQPFGWPLVVVSVPVSIVAGPVAAYNALVVLAFVAAAVATAALARALGLSRPAAAVAGFAFAFAPFRLVQATSHVNALLAFLLPLTLLLVERALRGERPRRAAWLAVACHLSLLASGELHLAVFSVPLVAGYVALRAPGVPLARLRSLAAPALALVAGTAVLALILYVVVLAPSVAGQGRSIEEAASFGPRLGDLADRSVTWGMFERYAYPGAVVAALALAGVVAAVRTRRHRLLAAGLLAGALVVTAHALLPGLTGHPSLQSLYRAVPLLSYSRVPGRILIVSALCLAVLAAVAVDAVPAPRLRRLLAVLALGAILVDAPPGLFARAPAGATAVDDVAAGTNLVHLPPFDAGHLSGASYTYLLTRSSGPRLNGYSPFVAPDADAALRAAAPLAEVPLRRCAWREAVDAHGIEQVAVHHDLFGDGPLQWSADGVALGAALDADRAFERVAEEGGVVRFLVHPEHLTCP